MSALKVALRARELLTHSWTSHTLARDVKGTPIAPCDPKAESWCFIGAVRRAQWELNAQNSVRREIFQHMEMVNPYPCSPVSVNDRYGRAAILALLEVAIFRMQRDRAACTEAFAS